MVGNAAVFVAKQRRFKGVNVEYDETSNEVVVSHRITGDVLVRYSVVEVALPEMAYDINDGGTIRRLVFQQGCGCSGQKPYKVQESYSGALPG